MDEAILRKYEAEYPGSLTGLTLTGYTKGVSIPAAKLLAQALQSQLSTALQNEDSQPTTLDGIVRTAVNEAQRICGQGGAGKRNKQRVAGSMVCYTCA